MYQYIWGSLISKNEYMRSLSLGEVEKKSWKKDDKKWKPYNIPNKFFSRVF